MKKFKYCPLCKSYLIKKMKDGDYRLTCEKCDWTHYGNPLPSVAALIRNKQGDILLIKRGVPPGKGKWALPTGFIEETELPEQAVLRELKEETNITGKISRLIGVYTERTSVYGLVILIGYEVIHLAGKIKPGSDTTQTKFFPANKLPKIVFSSHQHLINEALQDSEIAYIHILKSKITKATITNTFLHYKGSMGIDSKIMQAANLIPGEKVQVLNYNNGERLETYTIEEDAGSGKMILYGPASHKGKIGDNVCILAYGITPLQNASNVDPKIIVLDERNKIKREHT